MWCPYITKKIDCINIICGITILGGLMCFHPGMDRYYFVIIMCQHCAHCKTCKMDFGPSFFLSNFGSTQPCQDLVNCDIKIQHLKKVVSQGVNKIVMEHLMKLYIKTTLGYRLFAYDGCKSLCTIGPFPSKEFQISLLGEDDRNNTQRFLNQIPQK